MKPHKKIYPQAVLKNLPERRQEEIVEFLEVASIQEQVKQTHKDGAKSETTEFTRMRPPTLLEAVQWLAKDGIVISTAALSQFRSWFLLRRQMQINEDSSLELAKTELANTGATDEQVQALGQRFFNRMALQQQDPKQWFLAQKITLQVQEACLKALPALKQIAADPKLNQTDKINAYRAKLFGQLPA